jgi:hypothetical protein
MGDYGACKEPDRNQPAALPTVRGRLFIENPDGTITEGIPVAEAHKHNLKAAAEAAKRSQRRSQQGRRGSDSEETEGSVTEVAAAHVAQELEYLLTQHLRVFVLLLTIELLLEILYIVVCIRMMDTTVLEVVAMYEHKMPVWLAVRILWILCVAECVFVVVYNYLAVTAVVVRMPSCYKRFSTCSLVGIVGMVCFSYLDRFNLLVFFVRLLVYIYARYLQGLTTTMLLLPVTTPQHLDLAP